MSDSSVLVLEPAGATAEIDAEQITTTGPQGKPLRRERLQIGGSALAEIARVLNAAPAGTEYALVVRPIMPASTTVDVSDRDARLGGRVKLLDSLGNVIDPATKAQLPAALVGARLDTNIGAWLGSTVPTVGSKTSANSVPVVVASDQAAIPISTVAGAITPGTAATSLGKAEDAVLASGDTGVLALLMRRDVPNLPTVAETSNDGDYAAPVVDANGVLWVRKRQIRTYSAAYRLIDATAGQLSLNFTFVANTNKQLATIYHAATATKTVRIRRILLIVSTGAAGVFNFEVRALSAATAPATGNPAITARAHDSSDAAVEATFLALPTTAGSLVGADTGTVGVPFEWNSAAAAAVANPSGLVGQVIPLYDYLDEREAKPLVMRAGVAEGFAVNGRCTANVAGRFTVLIEATEE